MFCPKILQFIIIWNREKQQICQHKNLESPNVLYFWMTNDLNDSENCSINFLSIDHLINPLFVFEQHYTPFYITLQWVFKVLLRKKTYDIKFSQTC